MKRFSLRDGFAALALSAGVLAAGAIAFHRERAGVVGVTDWGPDGHPIYAYATPAWAVPVAIAVAILGIGLAFLIHRHRTA
jgi:hypothetical protein